MRVMPSPVSRRLLRRGLVAVAVVLAALGGAAALILTHAPGNVSHPNVEFTHPTVTPTPPAPAKPRKVVNNFQWPWYGFDPGRTRVFSAAAKLHPPLRIGWRYSDGGLLEFPPVIYQTTLYLVDDSGWVKAINSVNGRQRWARRLGTLAAASPAVAVQNRLVLVPLLSTNRTVGQKPSPGAGRFVAVSMRTGRVVWSHAVPAGTESSPIVQGQTVYFGDQGGTMYALRIRDGHVDWTYQARGAIKGGPALAGGVLYFGDYAGHAYALNAANGHEIWAVGTNGAHFGFGSGQFYSSPAVAFGRVYMGNTDGRVYSFGAHTGALAWATETGSYVYASPAVDNTPGLGPTVYIGSYDGNFYAFNAQSGAIRWKHPAGGKISGSATIIGNVVYYSDLGTKTSAGLDVRTGRQVFSFPDGAFNAVIADPKAIYLDGYGTVYQLLPGPRPRPAARKRSVGHTGSPSHKPAAGHPAPSTAQSRRAAAARKARARRAAAAPTARAQRARSSRARN
jgi:outer membrane protein assembly factor BamB